MQSCGKLVKLMNRVLFTPICAAALLGAGVANADPVDWTQYERSFNISFPGYAGSTTLTDFPVLVKLSAELNDRGNGKQERLFGYRPLTVWYRRLS